MEGLVPDLLLPSLFQDYVVVVVDDDDDDVAVVLHLVLRLDVDAVVPAVVVQRAWHPWSVPVGEVFAVVVVPRLSVPLHQTLVPSVRQLMDSGVVACRMTC
jgi:hypothetical protein